MILKVRDWAIVLALALCLAPSVHAKDLRRIVPAAKHRAGGAPVLWQKPDNISSRSLLYGPGGKAHQPKGTFKFIEEDFGGSKPKFKVEDDKGIRWKIKLGYEAQPETTATRLVWAVGYFTDEDYYLPELWVQGMKKLSRGQEFVSADGKIRGARLERHIKGEKKIGNWSWFKNPFVGTKEFNGLKIMMALINNNDLKTENNSIYDEEGLERRYIVSDLGSSFGKTGNIVTHSVGNWPDYLKSRFIRRIRAEDVDFVVDTRPPFLFVFALPYYIDRTRIHGAFKHIPRQDAKWIGELLSQLSEQQIKDAFRAGGFTPQQVDGYAGKVRERIAELNRL
jgi:hypothetical protein